MPKKLVALENGPNYQLDDAFVAFKSLLNIFNLGLKTAKAQVEKRLDTILEKKSDSKIPYFWFNSGRSGLFLLLKSLQLKPASEVLIQAFSCVVVPNAVWQSGLTPVVVDANAVDYNFDIENLQKKVTPQSKALIVQYTMGYIPNLEQTIEFCNTHNLILIEDCAHCFGVVAHQNGRRFVVGNIGQASILSFGRDKVVSSTSGGACFLNQGNFVEKKGTIDFVNWKNNLELEYSKLPRPSILFEFQSLFYVIATRLLVRPFYYFFSLGKVVIFLGNKLQFFSPIYLPPEKQGTNKIFRLQTFPDKLLFLLLNQLQKFENFNSRRQKLAQIYATELDLEFNQNNLYLRFVLDLSKIYGENYRDKYLVLKTKLKENGVLVGKWYDDYFLPSIKSSNLNLSSQNLPTAASLIDRRIFNLPTNILTSTEDAKRICQIILSLKNF